MNDADVMVAGATGDLGLRIAKALAARGARVRALVRPGLPAARLAPLRALGATPVEADPNNRAAVARACAGCTSVVSALNGLRDVIIDRQTVLLDAAIEAGAQRFIPSDFCEDFTRTTPGDNRNLDFRREFMARADRASLRVTSIFNGAFLELLGGDMPLVQPRLHRVLFWRSADQPLDFTAKDDVAAYTAAAALDPEAPRILRIAGDTATVRDLAAVLTRISGRRYRALRLGSLGSLGVMIEIARHAVHARHVQRCGQAAPARQRAVRRARVDIGRGASEALGRLVRRTAAR